MSKDSDMREYYDRLEYNYTKARRLSREELVATDLALDIKSKELIIKNYKKELARLKTAATKLHPPSKTALKIEKYALEEIVREEFRGEFEEMRRMYGYK